MFYERTQLTTWNVLERIAADDVALATGAAESTVQAWKRGRTPAPPFARRLARFEEIAAVLLEHSPTLNIGLWLTGRNEGPK